MMGAAAAGLQIAQGDVVDVGEAAATVLPERLLRNVLGHATAAASGQAQDGALAPSKFA